MKKQFIHIITSEFRRVIDIEKISSIYLKGEVITITMINEQHTINFDTESTRLAMYQSLVEALEQSGAKMLTLAMHDVI